MKCPQCHSINPPDSHFCRKCATPLPSESDAPFSQTKTVLMPVKELERGSIFAERYEVIEELGKGGMGRVYKVFDKKVNETIALKLIKPEIDTDEKTIERFRNELRFARKISHRHVCRMFDLGEEETSHFITMEYVPGENLKAFIRRSGKLTVEKAVSLAKQVGEGLAEAHSLGVVHRDLKPQNIMIDGVGNAKIMDFGIARSLSTEGITATGYIIGTPDYMSPEQVEGIESDQRSDIYSLGVILYEMVTGKLPFLGDTPMSVAVKHKTEIPQDPREIDDHIPEVLSHMILKCMEKDPEKRYQRAEDFLHELNNTEKRISRKEKIVTVTKPVPPKERKPPTPKRKSYVPLFIIIILVLISPILLKLIPKKHEVSPRSEIIIKKAAALSEEKGDIPEGSEDPKKETAIRKSPSAPETEMSIKGRIEDLLDLSEKEVEDVEIGAKVLGLLAPEVMKFIKDKDLQSFESTMEKIKGSHPEEEHYKEMWKQANDKIKEGMKLQEQGKDDEAQKSYVAYAELGIRGTMPSSELCRVDLLAQ